MNHRGRGDVVNLMPSVKAKTHKGAKKRFKVSANGKVSHKKCGSSHLMSHKSGKQVRKLRRKKILKVEAEARRLRRALGVHEAAATPLEEHEVHEHAATPHEVHEHAAEPAGEHHA